MIRRGTMISQRNNLAEIELHPLSGCGRCEHRGNCGIQLLPRGNSALLINCINSIDATPGQQVNVKVEPPVGNWLRLVCMAYGIPTVTMLAGTCIGYIVASTLGLPNYADIGAFTGFTVGLGGGLFAWQHVLRNGLSNCTVGIGHTSLISAEPLNYRP